MSIVHPALLAAALLATACAESSTSFSPPDPQRPVEPDAGEPDAAPVRQLALADGAFDMAPMDTGGVADSCVVAAPWGAGSWGIEASSGSAASQHKLSFSRFATIEGGGYLYGKEQAGQAGYVRYLQGSMWGGTNCGPTPWNQFEPVATSDRELSLELDIFPDTSSLAIGAADAQVAIAVDVWLSSPGLAAAGGDVNGKKPLVLDLLLHRTCSGAACSPGTHEAPGAYVYQAEVGAPLFGRWTSIAVPLTDHIDRAFTDLGLPSAARSDLAIYQIDVMIQLHNAEGAATIDNVALVER